MSKKETETIDIGNLSQPGASVTASAPVAAPAPAIAMPPELMTPQAQAFMAQQTSAMLKEVFASLRETLSGIALTPEKIGLMEKLRREPSEDAAKAAARNKREKKMMIDEQTELAATRQRTIDQCPHRYKTGAVAVNLINNTFDGRPRGICVLCQVLIHGKQWAVSNPTEENPKGELYIEEGSPKAQLDLLLEAMRNAN